MTCEFCRTEFEKRPSMKHRAQRFCGPRCASLSRYGATEVPGPICSVERCDRPARTRTLCTGHARRKRVWGDVRPDVPLRRVSPRGTVQSRHGYLMVGGYSGHPNANKDGLIRVHRLIMAETLGRALLPGENVHHINGDRADNRPENLELWITVQPAGQRVADVVDHAAAMLKRYAPHLLS